MRQKMVRHFCQWDSGEKLIRNNISLELKFFDEPFRKYLSLKNFKSQYQKYLTSEKYLEDHRRCKIEFRTTFVFYIKLIFPLLFELESLEKRARIFFSKYFQCSLTQKGVEKSSSMVLISMFSSLIICCFSTSR